MTSKEEFEIEKIKLEIAQMREPFWKKANVMISAVTVIITALIGFNSYFMKVNQENVSKIGDLEAKIKEDDALRQQIEVENLNLQKTQVEIQANEYKKKYEEYEAKLAEIEKQIRTNDKALAQSKARLTDAKNRYSQYKTNVKNVVEYMAGYGPGYAEGILKSNSGQARLDEIASIASHDERVQQIMAFTMNVVNQSFSKYINEKTGKLELAEPPALK